MADEPIETGAFIEIDFAKFRTPGCILINGKPPGDPVFAVSIDLDLSKTDGARLPVLSLRQYLHPSARALSQRTQRGYFIAEKDWCAFEAWRRG
jgi:hypothetical protein